MDNVDFNELLLQKRHKEIILILTKILEGIPTTIEANIPEQKNIIFDTKRIEQILTAIYKKEDNVSASIKTLSDAIVNKLKDITTETKPKEWTHTVIRDNNGLMVSIKSKSK